MKQTQLRKRRVVRFAIVYFSLLILFIVLLAAPLVIRRLHVFNPTSLGLMDLVQPLDSNNNDTAPTFTGSHLPKGFKAGSGYPDSGTSASAT